MSDNKYNGWENYATWNIALWIGNDEKFYSLAKGLKNLGYSYFCEAMEYRNIYETPDGVSWVDNRVNVAEIDQMMDEL